MALSKCTSGFAVENNIGDMGITTAAHCEGDIQYNGNDLNAVDGLDEGFLDLRWMTTPDFTPVNEIEALK